MLLQSLSAEPHTGEVQTSSSSAIYQHPQSLEVIHDMPLQIKPAGTDIVCAALENNNSEMFGANVNSSDNTSDSRACTGMLK